MSISKCFGGGIFFFLILTTFTRELPAWAEEGHVSNAHTEAAQEAQSKVASPQTGLLSVFLKKIEDRQKLEKASAPFKSDEFACVKSLAEIHQEGVNEKNYQRVFSMNDWIFFPLGNGYYGIREYTSASGLPATKEGPISVNHFFITNGKEELRYRVNEVSKGTFSSTNTYEFDVAGNQDLKVEWQSETGIRTDVVKPIEANSVVNKELAKPQLTSKMAFDKSYSIDSLMRRSLDKTFKHFENMGESYRSEKYNVKMASKFILQKLDQSACEKAGYGNYIQKLKKYSEENI